MTKIYAIEKNGRGEKTTWRQVRSKISRCIQHGACERWIKYADLPYLNEVPPTKHFDQVMRHGTMMTLVGVHKSYISTDALDKSDMILYTLYPDGEVSSFALLRFGDTNMEISVICSLEGVSAKPLLLRSLEIAREKKKRYATLHALRHVLGYYPKFGFQRRGVWSTGNNIDGWLMEKNLSSRLNYALEAPQPMTGIMTPAAPRPLRPAAARPSRPVAPPRRGRSKFPVDSIVWVKQNTYPWWPAQVKEPTAAQLRAPHANGDVFVAFFDDKPSHAWIRPSQVHEYKQPPHHAMHLRESKRYARLERAIIKADLAYDFFSRQMS